MLVVVVLFAFLRNVRTTLIICTAIPISIIGTFALIYFAGFTLNTLTFGGLALGVGMIVDASIVVLENTFRHMEGGKDRTTASVDGAEEVSGAIRRVDPDAGGGLPAVALLDRGLEHRLRPVGGRGDDRARDVAVRGRDPGAGDDVTAAAAAAAAGPAEGCLRPVPDCQ